MKKLLLGLLLVFCEVVCAAPDVIYQRYTFKEIKGKVVEITEDHVYFKKKNDNSTYYLDKSDVYSVRYDDGRTVVFSHAKKKNVQDEEVEVAEEVAEVKPTPKSADTKETLKSDELVSDYAEKSAPENEPSDESAEEDSEENDGPTTLLSDQAAPSTTVADASEVQTSAESSEKSKSETKYDATSAKQTKTDYSTLSGGCIAVGYDYLGLKHGTHGMDVSLVTNQVFKQLPIGIYGRIGYSAQFAHEKMPILGSYVETKSTTHIVPIRTHVSATLGVGKKTKLFVHAGPGVEVVCGETVKMRYDKDDKFVKQKGSSSATAYAALGFGAGVAVRGVYVMLDFDGLLGKDKFTSAVTGVRVGFGF